MDRLLRRLLFILFFFLLLKKINGFSSPAFPLTHQYHKTHQPNEESCYFRKLDHEIHWSYSL